MASHVAERIAPHAPGWNQTSALVQSRPPPLPLPRAGGAGLMRHMNRADHQPSPEQARRGAGESEDMSTETKTERAEDRIMGGDAMKMFLLLLGFLTFFATGCGDSVQKARSQAGQALTNAAGSLSNYLANYKAGNPSNFLAFRAQLRAMKTSLASNDFSKARGCAEEIDKLLKTKVVSQSIEFLRIGSADGAQKAKAAVSDYMAKNNLEVTETEACRELLRYFEEMDKRQSADLVAAIVYIALENKMSHSAAIPADLAHVMMEELLGIGAASNSPPTAVEPK